MYLNIDWYQLPLLVLANFWLGWTLGKLHERAGWNERIEEANDVLKPGEVFPFADPKNVVCLNLTAWGDANVMSAEDYKAHLDAGWKSVGSS